jgi:hypothetical protein
VKSAASALDALTELLVSSEPNARFDLSTVDAWLRRTNGDGARVNSILKIVADCGVADAVVACGPDEFEVLHDAMVARVLTSSYVSEPAAEWGVSMWRMAAEAAKRTQAAGRPESEPPGSLGEGADPSAVPAESKRLRERSADGKRALRPGRVAGEAVVTSVAPTPAGSSARDPRIVLEVAHVNMVRGRGTMVSGELLADRVAPGDDLEIVGGDSPLATRVISLESDGGLVNVAHAGQHVSMILRGVSPLDVGPHYLLRYPA